MTTLSGQTNQVAQRALVAGSAIAGVGTAIAAIGSAGVAFMYAAANAAADYRQQAALTKTQVDGFKVSVEELEDIGLRIAKTIPAPLRELQPALYDIFSSLEVNVQQADKMLKAFARGAVAGQTDVQTAGRSTIAIMNAFKIPAEDVNKVMDLQFQLVRKGVGTYEEFASTIGTAIPATVNAGQSIETLAGMLSFLTRNGLNAAKASTSAARALDAMANPKVQERLEAMGIATRDLNGQFRPLSDVLGDLNAKWSNLTKPEKAAALQELLKGAGGTIQARRFFNLALDNFDQLKARIDEMSSENVIGAMKKAYNIMFRQPQSQTQLFKNNLEALKIEIGRGLLPIKEKLIAVGLKVLKMFNSLSPGVRKTIVVIGALLSILLLVSGVILTIVGSIMAFSALMTILGVSLGAVAGITAGILTVFALLAAAGYLIYKNWDTIGPFFENLWNRIKDAFASVVGFIKDHVDEIKQTWENLKSDAQDVWEGIRNSVVDAFHRVRAGIERVWSSVSTLFKTVWEDVSSWWEKNKRHFIDSVQGLWKKLSENVSQIWEPLKEATVHVVNLLLEWFSTGWNILLTIVSAVVDAITWVWKNFGDEILQYAMIIWDYIVGVVRGAMDIVFGIIKLVLAIINGDWGAAWDAIKQIFEGAWNLMINTLNTAKDLIVLAVETLLELIWTAIQKLPGWLWDIATSAIRLMVEGFLSLSGWVTEQAWNIVLWVVNQVKALPDHLWAWGMNGIQRLWDGIVSLKDWIIEKAKNIVEWVINQVKDLPDKMADIGKNAGKSLMSGIFKTMSPIPGLPGIPGLPRIDVPFLASGDIIRAKETVAVLHGPEAVIPLNNANRAMELMRQSGLLKLAAANLGGGGSTQIVNNIQINNQVTAHTNADPYAISRELAFMQKTNPFPMPTSTSG
jgi:TP901 family phage tail tape measure protein